MRGLTGMVELFERRAAQLRDLRDLVHDRETSELMNRLAIGYDDLIVRVRLMCSLSQDYDREAELALRLMGIDNPETVFGVI